MQAYSFFLVECLLGFLLLFVSLPVDGDLTDPSLLPFLPTEEQLTSRLDPQLLAIANGGRKGGKIPRIIWVAVANASEPLPGPFLNFIQRNTGWLLQVKGNREKDVFIDTVFSGTSIQWAYNAINPKLGAAKADVWRYAVMWCYGGFYMDYDSDFGVLLDDAILPTDTLLVAQDGTPFHDYFRPTFKISNSRSFKNGTTIAGSGWAKYVDGYAKDGYPAFFGGKFLLNWAIFSERRSPAMSRTLTNIIALLWSEYQRESVVMMFAHTPKFQLLLFCTTFVFSTSVRELLLDNAPGFTPRVCGVDFKEYGGKCKAIWTGNDPTHYRKILTNADMPEILSSYSTNLTRAKLHIEGWPIMTKAAGKSIFLVRRGLKCPVGSYDMFLKYNMSNTRILWISEAVFRSLELGPTLE